MVIRQPTIAIVDNDTSVLRALGRLLKEAGYRVDSYASGWEALSGVPGSQAICLVIDCQLGDMSGIELGRQLSEAGNRSAIIFMTGSENDMIHRQAMTFGCAAYLKKPFHGNDLLSSIVVLTGESQLVCESS